MQAIVLRNELHVERPGDLKFPDYFFCYLLCSANCFQIRALRRQDDRCVAGVRARVLDVLRDGVDNEFAALCDAVYLDLARIVDEFRNDYWVVGGNIRGAFEIFHERRLIVRNAHGCAREDVGRPDEDRVTDFFGSFQCRGGRRELGPFGLVDLDAIEQCGKSVTVFGSINIKWARAEYFDALFVERHRKVVGYLSTG